MTKKILFEEWADVDDGESVIISGVLTVKPGTFNKRTAIIQDPENPLALELYFHKAEWPELDLNALLTVSGEKSVTQQGSRLLIRSADDIVIDEIADLNP